MDSTETVKKLKLELAAEFLAEGKYEFAPNVMQECACEDGLIYR